MPTISPARTSSDTSFKLTPNGSMEAQIQVDAAVSSIAAPVAGVSWHSRNSPPTIIRARLSFVCSRGIAVPATRPPRRTVAESHSVRTFIELVADEQNAYAARRPAAAAWRTSVCTACGESTEVGSSSISSRGDSQQATNDLHSLAFAGRHAVHEAMRGSTGKP